MQFLPYPASLCTPSLLPYLVCSNPETPKQIFHFKFMTWKLFQTYYVTLGWPVAFNWKLYLTSILCYPTFLSCSTSSPIPLVLEIEPYFFPDHRSTISSWILSYLPSFVACRKLRAYFYFLPSNTLTHPIAALLRTVDRIQCKELGMQTGRRSSLME